MAHVRTQIRQRVTAILTGLPTTGPRVYPSRVHPMTAETMPGLCVYIKNESAKVETDEILLRSIDLVVDAYVKGVSFD